MDAQPQNPAAQGTTTSPVNGEAVAHVATIEGFASPALVPSPGTPPTTAVRKKQPRREAGQGAKHRDQGNGVAAAAVPFGFDRVCALLAEAVIGMMAGTLPSSTGQCSRPAAPAQGDSKPTTRGGPPRSSLKVDDRIVGVLSERGSASPAALRAKLGLQRTPCTKALNRLLAKGVLVGTGSTRKRVYRLAQPSQSAAA